MLFAFDVVDVVVASVMVVCVQTEAYLRFFILTSLQAKMEVVFFFEYKV